MKKYSLLMCKYITMVTHTHTHMVTHSVLLFVSDDLTHSKVLEYVTMHCRGGGMSGTHLGVGGYVCLQILQQYAQGDVGAAEPIGAEASVRHSGGPTTLHTCKLEERQKRNYVK